MGSLPRVKETLEASSRVSTELSNLLSVKETSVMSFAVKPPGGMSKLVPLEGDLLGNTLDSMQFVSGSLDVDAAGAGLHIAGRTSSPAAANELKDSLEGLAAIGKMFLDSSKRADQKIYARMLGNAKLVVRGSDVNMDLLVPQTDIDVLLAERLSSVAVRRAYTLFRWERVARSLAALYADAEASANAGPKQLLPVPAVPLPGVVAAA